MESKRLAINNGDIFTPVTLEIHRENMTIPQEPTPFGFCFDNGAFPSIVTHNQLNRITCLKFHIDGGKDFFKISLNIISMKPKGLDIPIPNSVLTNSVITMAI